jgi:hypothetical protein
MNNGKYGNEFVSWKYLKHEENEFLNHGISGYFIFWTLSVIMNGYIMFYHVLSCFIQMWQAGFPWMRPTRVQLGVLSAADRAQRAGYLHQASLRLGLF